MAWQRQAWSSQLGAGGFSALQTIAKTLGLDAVAYLSALAFAPGPTLVSALLLMDLRQGSDRPAKGLHLCR